MKKYIDFKNSYDKDKLNEVALCLKNGGLVIFPTETVYGLGANGLDSEAVKKIFDAKGRIQDNPLIMHVANIKMIEDIASDITELEYEIIKKFFPGPITLILKKKDIVPNEVTANLDTVGVRMPQNIIARGLIELAKTPIAAPSANKSGRPSGTTIKDIYDELEDKVDYIIDGGDTIVGVESTVIRVIDDEIHILRPGVITKEDLEVLGKAVIIDKHVLESVKTDEVVLSPGMKYKHYAPVTKCLLVYSLDEVKMINKIKELENESTLVVCRESHKNNYQNCLSYGDTLEEISHNLFRILREVDEMNKELIIFEGVEQVGLGLAIMNRLLRACSHNYICI